MLVGGAPGPAAARTRLDARIDALTTQQLLTRNPAVLVDAARQRRARAIADLRHGASAAWGIVQIIAFWWMWRSGTGARLRDFMRRRTRNRAAQRAVFGAALGALGPIVAFPFAVLSYRVGVNAGVTDERIDRWFLGYVVRIALDAALGAVIVTSVLWLVERVRGWYLVVIAGLYGGALLAVAIVPILGIGTPAKTTPTAVALVGSDVARRLGVPGTPVVVLASSRHTNAESARAAGIGPTRRVILADVTLEHETAPELRMAIGHADAHVAQGDTLRETLVAVTLFVFAAAIAVLLSDRVGFRRDDDALSRLALVATFLGLVLIAAYPIYTSYVRSRELASDGLLVSALGDRASVVRAMIRYADDDLAPLCDRRSVRWYFDETPPLGARIASITGHADPCLGNAQSSATAAETAVP